MTDNITISMREEQARELKVSAHKLFLDAGFTSYHNGGGLMALSLNREDKGLYALVTDDDDCVFSGTSPLVSIGIYDAHTGEPTREDCAFDVPIWEAPALAKKMLEEESPRIKKPEYAPNSALDQLTKILQWYCAANSLPYESADDLLVTVRDDTAMSEAEAMAHTKWLEDFIATWEQAQHVDCRIHWMCK